MNGFKQQQQQSGVKAPGGSLPKGRPSQHHPHNRRHQASHDAMRRACGSAGRSQQDRLSLINRSTSSSPEKQTLERTPILL